MNMISTAGQFIDYQRDPSTQSQVNLQHMFSTLQCYNQINKTKKNQLKKSKKNPSKYELQKQKPTQSQNISNILRNVRKNNIIQEFINRLKMNIIHRNLKIQDQNQYFSIGKTSIEQDFKKKIRQAKIHKVLQNQTFDIVVILLKFLIIVGILYINSLKLVFENLNFLNQVLNAFIIVSICLFLIELTGMISTIYKYRINFWKNFYYWAEKQNVLWSLILNFGLILELTNFSFMPLFIIVLMTPELMNQIKNFKKVQSRFVLSVNFQRYWELSKIVLFNFCIAHILSIVLNLMGSIQVPHKNNWYTQKKISSQDDWTIKYIWGYYWGTNIMLTVGFGDISAQNHVQAGILIFIETIACMIMAYNISEVSRILQNISQIDQQRKFKFKVFNQMSQKYHFQDQFKTNVINHIDKSIEKKHQLNYIQENLIEELPEKIKLEVKREVNKNVFLSTYFFKNLTKKTQNLLALKVHKIFAHPQQTILKNLQTWKIYILRQGSVAITFKKGSSVNNGTVIQQFTVDEITKPQLLSLKFIRKIPIKGDLKSLDFSILNMLQIEHFQKILREDDPSMFEFYCSERDKTQYHLFDLEIKNCGICVHSKHDKFQCPKMHYVPLKDHIVYKKKLFNRGQKMNRRSLFERKKYNFNPFKIFYESSKDEQYQKKNLKQYTEIIMSSFRQIIHPIHSFDNTDMSRKIDKCIQKLDEGLKIMKGIVDVEELESDIAYNYKRYFPQQNPDNLVFCSRDQIKRSKKAVSQKKIKTAVIL